MTGGALEIYTGSLVIVMTLLTAVAGCVAVACGKVNGRAGGGSVDGEPCYDFACRGRGVRCDGRRAVSDVGVGGTARAARLRVTQATG